jgi:hypothetical protein
MASLLMRRNNPRTPLGIILNNTLRFVMRTATEQSIIPLIAMGALCMILTFLVRRTMHKYNIAMHSPNLMKRTTCAPTSRLGQGIPNQNTLVAQNSEMKEVLIDMIPTPLARLRIRAGTGLKRGAGTQTPYRAARIPTIHAAPLVLSAVDLLRDGFKMPWKLITSPRLLHLYLLLAIRNLQQFHLLSLAPLSLSEFADHLQVPQSFPTHPCQPKVQSVTLIHFATV